jgi:hypothetical protein
MMCELGTLVLRRSRPTKIAIATNNTRRGDYPFSDLWLNCRRAQFSPKVARFQGSSLLSGSLFLRENENLHISFECLEHARHDSSSRSAVRHLLRHFPDPGCELSREPQALRGRQQKAATRPATRPPSRNRIRGSSFLITPPFQGDHIGYVRRPLADPR